MTRQVGISAKNDKGDRTSISLHAALYDYGARFYGSQEALRDQVRKWVAKGADSYSVAGMLIELIADKSLRAKPAYNEADVEADNMISADFE